MIAMESPCPENILPYTIMVDYRNNLWKRPDSLYIPHDITKHPVIVNEYKSAFGSLNNTCKLAIA